MPRGYPHVTQVSLLRRMGTRAGLKGAGGAADSGWESAGQNDKEEPGAGGPEGSDPSEQAGRARVARGWEDRNQRRARSWGCEAHMGHAETLC